jgi:hypothetical protein
MSCGGYSVQTETTALILRKRRQAKTGVIIVWLAFVLSLAMYAYVVGYLNEPERIIDHLYPNAQEVNTHLESDPHYYKGPAGLAKQVFTTTDQPERVLAFYGDYAMSQGWHFGYSPEPYANPMSTPNANTSRLGLIREEGSSNQVYYLEVIATSQEKGETQVTILLSFGYDWWSSAPTIAPSRPAP